MIISFDFDGTLENDWVQELAKIFIAAGHEAHITTSRCTGVNKDLEKVARQLNITKINYTDGSYKSETLRVIGADIHFDDMEDEVHKINLETDCNALLVNFDISMTKYLFDEYAVHKFI